MKQEIEKMKSRLLLLAFILMVPIGVFAQNITVKGNVTDSEGEPIIGATVMELSLIHISEPTRPY